MESPVKDWLHEIEAKRQKKSEQKQKRKEKAAQTAKKADVKPPERKTEPEQV
jgi:hypothetical protein